MELLLAYTISLIKIQSAQLVWRQLLKHNALFVRALASIQLARNADNVKHSSIATTHVPARATSCRQRILHQLAYSAREIQFRRSVPCALTISLALIRAPAIIARVLLKESAVLIPAQPTS